MSTGLVLHFPVIVTFEEIVDLAECAFTTVFQLKLLFGIQLLGEFHVDYRSSAIEQEHVQPSLLQSPAASRRKAEVENAGYDAFVAVCHTGRRAANLGTEEE